MFTIVVGNCWDGMKLWGLFSSPEAACNVADKEFDNCDWHILEINYLQDNNTIEDVYNLRVFKEDGSIVIIDSFNDEIEKHYYKSLHEVLTNRINEYKLNVFSIHTYNDGLIAWYRK